ncbi:hypothetical protein LZ31DRAFT_220774 [Colletotrichum somersetense]|nr:hypothetical protein LZ31DRAFT_220774 [Colletotrichum somersetense]
MLFIDTKLGDKIVEYLKSSWCLRATPLTFVRSVGHTGPTPFAGLSSGHWHWPKVCVAFVLLSTVIPVDLTGPSKNACNIRKPKKKGQPEPDMRPGMTSALLP